MPWIKHGCLFNGSGQRDWMQTHAQLPVVDRVDHETLRVYFATRDADERSRVGFVDVCSAVPHRVLRISERPALDLGELGCFDDCGVLPSWITNWNGSKRLYYIGVNTATNIPGRTAIGVAESRDGGETFTRIWAGPIVERGGEEAHLVTAPCVLPGPEWRMWYASGTGWEIVDGRPEPRYLIRQRLSPDGLRWQRPGTIALGFDDDSEGGLARPSVRSERDGYRMWFCRRGRQRYRLPGPTAYRLGYAESADGSAWLRASPEDTLTVSDAGWDREMIAYPHVVSLDGRLEMFYNGNGFGLSGFGSATWSDAPVSWMDPNR